MLQSVSLTLLKNDIIKLSNYGISIPILIYIDSDLYSNFGRIIIMTMNKYNELIFGHIDTESLHDINTYRKIKTHLINGNDNYSQLSIRNIFNNEIQIIDIKDNSLFRTHSENDKKRIEYWISLREDMLSRLYNDMALYYNEYYNRNVLIVKEQLDYKNAELNKAAKSRFNNCILMKLNNTPVSIRLKNNNLIVEEIDEQSFSLAKEYSVENSIRGLLDLIGRKDKDAVLAALKNNVVAGLPLVNQIIRDVAVHTGKGKYNGTKELVVDLPLTLRVADVNAHINNLINCCKYVLDPINNKNALIDDFTYLGDRRLLVVGDAINVYIGIYNSKFKNVNDMRRIIKLDCTDICRAVYKHLNKIDLTKFGKVAPLNFYRVHSFKMLGTSEILITFKLKIPDHDIEVDRLDTLKH